MSTDDVELAKAAIIERCIRRIREEYQGNPANLRDHLTKQDSIILNLQRACEAAIDLAMHRVRMGALGIPQDSREAFELLVGAQRLERKRADSLKRMVGFRNIAVHDYRALNLDVVQAIVERHLDDLAAFAAVAS
jgi:uncharacterized protein YutE (UPF0331/DUF86 family)